MEKSDEINRVIEHAQSIADSKKNPKGYEEHLILMEGFEDVVHNFIEDDVPTMNKSRRYPNWRPDKIVMERIAPEA